MRVFKGMCEGIFILADSKCKMGTENVGRHAAKGWVGSEPSATAGGLKHPIERHLGNHVKENCVQIIYALFCSGSKAQNRKSSKLIIKVYRTVSDQTWYWDLIMIFLHTCI